MPSKEKFVITIGDFGSIVTLHSKSTTKNSLFLETLDEEAQATLKTLFNANKSAPITILLDTLDQTYRRKTYPLISLASLRSIAKREMESDGDKTSFKNYITSIPKKSSGIKKTECLFISASRSEVVDEWLRILMELPNRVTGIYVLPVESFDLYHLLKKKQTVLTAKSKEKTHHHDLYCMIVQTKVGGIRQIVYSEHSIIFTRIVSYDLQEDWLEKYEQDIYSTFEYLKRSFPTINITELYITNILSEDILSKIRSLDNAELNFTNYTPFQAAEIIGEKSLLSQDEQYSDLLISKAFYKEKKILKFTTPQIVSLEKLFLVLQSSYILNAAISLSIIAAIISIALFARTVSSKVNLEENNKKVATQNLNNVKNIASKENIAEGIKKSDDIEKIIDLGKVDETLLLVGKDFLEIYSEFKFLKKYDTSLSSFGYDVPDFNYKNPNKDSKYNFFVKGNIYNASGDIDDLFKGFDNLSSTTKKSFADYKVEYQEISRAINFTQKYYEYPIEFTIKKI